jgi:hypothetical protein
MKDGGVKNLTYQAKTANEVLKPNQNNNRGGFGLPKRCETSTGVGPSKWEGQNIEMSTYRTFRSRTSY